MQAAIDIDRRALRQRRSCPSHCALQCADCTGLCLEVFMMLTAEEKDAVCCMAGARIQ